MLQVYVLHNIQTDYSDYSIYSMSIYVRILHTNRAGKTTVVVEFNLRAVPTSKAEETRKSSQSHRGRAFAPGNLDDADRCDDRTRDRRPTVQHT